MAVGLMLVTCISVLVAGVRENGTAFTPTPAPAISGVDLNGKPLSTKSLGKRLTVLYVFSVRCPSCNAYTDRVRELVRQYGGDGRVQFVGVHSTRADRAVPVAEIRAQMAVSDLSFPVLDDRDGRIARRLKVTRTPTVVVLDDAGQIRYRGAIDDNRDAGATTVTYARNALDAVLAFKPVTFPATTEVGCDIFKGH